MSGFSFVRRWTGLLLAMCLCAASFAGERQHFEISGLMVDVSVPWGSERGHGHVPYLVFVENPSKRERTISMELEVPSWRNRVGWVGSRRLRLEPGERVRFEFDVPNFLDRLGTLDMRLLAGREEIQARLTTAAQFRRGTYPILAYLTSNLPPSDLDVRLAESVADGKVEINSGPTAKLVPNLAVSVCDLQELPRRATGYSSLDAVVLDATGRFPEGPELEALLAWVRVGGQLVVAGEDSTEQMAQRLGLPGLVGERYLLKAASGAEALPTYSLGHGTCSLIRLTREVAADPSFIAAARAALERGRSNVKLLNARDGVVPPNRIPGVERLPLRFLLFVLIAFAVVIGPLNTGWVKKRNRPALLLVTVPVISAVTSVAILAFGMLYQGLGVKATRDTFTILDHATDTADSIEWRGFYAGLSPGPGLRPAVHTTVWPQGLPRSEEVFRSRQDDGILLAGYYQPVRRPARQVISSSGAGRGRVSFQAKGGTVEVHNELEVDLLGVFYVDEEGSTYQWKGVLAPGSKAEASKHREPKSLESDDIVNGVLGLPSYRRLSNRTLAPGAYLAHAAGNPFADDLGLEFDVEATRHLLLGYLAPEEMQEQAR